MITKEEISKRDYFAAMAMQGILPSDIELKSTNPVYVAEYAVQCAAELIKQLAKTK